ncbi:MAG: sulfatase [Acidobacteria bacterium]|nr:sulfatase [Acidobacteriota bacterium]
MNRRTFVAMSAAAAVAAAKDTAAQTQEKHDKRPNIILLLGDDHRASALGCMGNSMVKTSHLDKLARNGVLFENHFCTTPICCISRASIMLGQYASTHDILNFDKPLSAEQVDRSYFSLLRKAGYHTGFIGKFGVGKTMPEKSFDVWNGFGGQGHYFPQGEPGPHLTDIMADQTDDFLKSAPKDKPFCLSVSYKAPHEQDEDPRVYLPSKETRALYDGMHMPPPYGAGSQDINRFPLEIQRSENRRRWAPRFSTPALYQESVKGYYALVSGIDKAMGRLRTTLAQQGLAENTIILYSADHGCYNGEHGFSGKWYAHEESIRIPLIVFDPRQPATARGKRKKNKTLNIDLHPTVLDFAGVQAPENTQGHSFAAEIRNQQAAPREIFFIEHHFPFKGFIPSSDAIRTSRWKYIRYTDNAAPFEELYDLQLDRHETKNLAKSPQHAKHLKTLQGYCTKWKESFAQKGAWSEPVTAADAKRDGVA